METRIKGLVDWLREPARGVTHRPDQVRPFHMLAWVLVSFTPSSYRHRTLLVHHLALVIVPRGILM
jgi:hypothetical protein